MATIAVTLRVVSGESLGGIWPDMLRRSSQGPLKSYEWFSVALGLSCKFMSTRKAKNLVPDKPDQAMDWMEELSCQCPIMPHHLHLCIYPLNGLVTLQRRARRARRLDFTLIVCNNSAQRSGTKPYFPGQICHTLRYNASCRWYFSTTVLMPASAVVLNWYASESNQLPSSCFLRMLSFPTLCDKAPVLYVSATAATEVWNSRATTIGPTRCVLVWQQIAEILVHQMHPSLNWDCFVF